MGDGVERDHLTFGANLALAALGAEVARAFEAAGIRSVLIKGPVLVHWLYGGASARASVDVDVLIDPATLGAAEEVLAELGFERAPTGIGADERPRHASTWVRAAGAQAVDLHTTIVGVGVSRAEGWTVLRERTTRETVAGSSLDVPAPDARLVLLALHAAQHGAREPQPLRDLERALELATPAEWREAARLAARLDAEGAFAAGLGLVERGRVVRDELGLPAAWTVEAALRARTAPALALGLDWLTQLPGLRPRLRFVIQKLFPPPAFMRVWSPLARRGRAGLVAAYLWRPLWLALRAGPAIAALRRARKESRS
jgi:hypothetical protein